MLNATAVAGRVARGDDLLGGTIEPHANTPALQITEPAATLSGGRGMSGRVLLPNRRASEVFDLEAGGLKYTASLTPAITKDSLARRAEQAMQGCLRTSPSHERYGLTGRRRP
jgi:hypothetical protein